jgi:hypothetical protein
MFMLGQSPKYYGIDIVNDWHNLEFVECAVVKNAI